MFSVSKRPTIKEVQELYKLDKALPSHVFQFFLNRSKQIDKKIHAVQTFTENLGYEESQVCDKILDEYKEKFEDNWFDHLISDYPLFGVPYSLKSIILVRGLEFTGSSKVLRGFTSPYSSTVYKKVKKAGGVLVSINYNDEFAMGSSGENCAYTTTSNPFDHERVPGGSSSGSAAAVSSGQVVFSLGTDTGGSIRQPASFCDIVGLKPTYGLVSRYGVMPMASSLDQVGPLANSIRDSMIVTFVISGQDSHDQQSLNSDHVRNRIKDLFETKPNRVLKKITTTPNPLKIGIPKEFYGDGDTLHPTVRGAMLELQSKLSSLGHELVQVSLPSIKQAIGVYYMIMSVEVASNMERFDGIRYRGSNPYRDDEKLFFDYRWEYFGDEVKRRILLGTYASSAGYYDAFYNKAAKVREKIRSEVIEAFRTVSVLLTPTTPELPFKIGEKTNDPLKMYLSDIMTVVANPIRIPGLTVPLGLFDVELKESIKHEVHDQKALDSSENEVNQSGVEENKSIEVTEQFIPTQDLEELVPESSSLIKLPTGCQILAPEFSEDLLFKLGEEIEMVMKKD